MRIETPTRYPVKSLPAEPLADVQLTPGRTLPGDRRFAFARVDAPFDPAAADWLPKWNFACLLRNAGLARLRAALDPATDHLTMEFPDRPPLVADTTTLAGRAALGDAMTAYLGAAARGRLRFVDSPGHAFTDQRRQGISLLNLASLAALEAACGTPLDPRRFRANVVVSGIPAWAEFDWVGRDIRLGAATLHVFKRTVRCAAVEVNPDTAERDADPVRWLKRAFGHADLGVHAAVLTGGRIAPGEVPIGPA